MEIGIVGLGRRGGNIARRLARSTVRVVGFDVESGTRLDLQEERVIEAAESVRAMVARLSAPRVVWLMLPAGTATELTIADVWPELARGDVVVDGGNAHYKDSQRRAAALASAGIQFVDCGISGDVRGLENGYTLMYGAKPEAMAAVLPYMKILACGENHGHVHCGAPGAGHFVTMIHKGIESGMMQACAEGFALLQNKRDLGLDLVAIAQTWRHGSTVGSSLLDLTAELLDENAALVDVAPAVGGSGEGRWTIQEAVEQGVPAPVLSAALMSRFASQGRGEYAAKLVALMHKASGVHAVQSAGGVTP